MPDLYTPLEMALTALLTSNTRSEASFGPPGGIHAVRRKMGCQAELKFQGPEGDVVAQCNRWTDHEGSHYNVTLRAYWGGTEMRDIGVILPWTEVPRRERRH